MEESRKSLFLLSQDEDVKKYRQVWLVNTECNRLKRLNC